MSDLRLVLQSAKGLGMQNAVAVALELRAKGALRHRMTARCIHAARRQGRQQSCLLLLQNAHVPSWLHLLFNNHNRDLRFLHHLLADAADKDPLEEAETTAAHDDEIRLLLLGKFQNALGDVPALDVLARRQALGQLLPDTVKDDMARDILVDVARDVDKIQLRTAFSAIESASSTALQPLTEPSDRDENFLDVTHHNPS